MILDLENKYEAWKKESSALRIEVNELKTKLASAESAKQALTENLNTEREQNQILSNQNIELQNKIKDLLSEIKALNEHKLKYDFQSTEVDEGKSVVKDSIEPNNM